MKDSRTDKLRAVVRRLPTYDGDLYLSLHDLHAVLSPLVPYQVMKELYRLTAVNNGEYVLRDRVLEVVVGFRWLLEPLTHD